MPMLMATTAITLLPFKTFARIPLLFNFPGIKIHTAEGLGGAKQLKGVD